MTWFRGRIDKPHFGPPASVLTRFLGNRYLSHPGDGNPPETDKHESVVRWRNDQAILDITRDRIRSLGHSFELGRQLTDLLSDSNVQVLRVDLGRVDRVSSETLTQLIQVHCRASQLGKQLVLENVTSTVRDVLHVTRLDRLFGFGEENSAEQKRLV